jgi:Tol biopolymer transport system component
MKRHFLTLSLALASLGALTVSGCGGGSTPVSPVKLAGKLAFSLGEGTNADINFDIYTQNADGTGRVRLTTDPAFDTDPALSPDGKTIAFVSDREGTPNLYTMSADGTNIKRLTESTINALGVVGGSDPAWSADGRQIAYSAVNDEAGSSICIVNADGTELRRITERFGYADVSPSFSPDGTKIIFERAQNIVVVNADGTNLQQLTTDNGSQLALNANPVYSPSGAQIVFTSRRDGVLDARDSLVFEIYKMNADGSGQTRLTNEVDDNLNPIWSSDGTKILFTSARGTSGGIFVMNADGTEQTKVSDTFGLNLSWR